MKTKIILVLALNVLIASCTSQPEQTVENNSGLIEITKAQFESEKMTIGEPLLYPFAEMVYFTGTIVPSTDGHAYVSVPVSGKITEIYCKPGQIVNKGSIMFYVSGNELIDIQKDFAVSSAVISRLKSEYARAKELFNENIATQKDFEFSESNYFAEKANYTSLKIKLESMGLDVSKIEKGEFYSSYGLKAPIQGYVSRIHTTIGQYVDPQQNIAEIIDDQSFQLRLSVFEKNMYKLQIGQTVNFFLNGNKKTKYKATINSVGKSIMSDSKSIECYALIDNPKRLTMINNQFIEGEVCTAIDSALSVPETAIIKSENETYVLFYEKEENSIFYFKKVKVNTGRKDNNFIEITEQLPLGKLLVNGIYNIQIE